MKKIFVAVAALALVFASTICAQSKEPETAPKMAFEGSEKSFVIDAVSLNKKFKDNVRLISALEGEHDFLIRFFDVRKNDWVLLGSAKLLKFGDTSFVDSNRSIGNRRWIAVTPGQKEDCVFTINAFHNDLYIYIFPKNPKIDESIKAKATILDSADFSGKFKDNISIVNNTLSPTEEYTVYGFNEGKEWSKIGVASFTSVNAENVINTPYEKVSIFRFFAVVPKSGNKYSYSLSVGHNDLIVTANGK